MAGGGWIILSTIILSIFHLIRKQEKTINVLFGHRAPNHFFAGRTRWHLVLLSSNPQKLSFFDR